MVRSRALTMHAACPKHRHGADRAEEPFVSGVVSPAFWKWKQQVEYMNVYKKWKWKNLFVKQKVYVALQQFRGVSENG